MFQSLNILKVNGQNVFFDKGGVLQFGPDDPDDPKNYSFLYKCYITAVSITLVTNATIASSAPTGAIQGIIDEFHVSTESAGLITMLFLLGYVAGPMLWAPLSEYYGRRWIFGVSFGLYFAFSILCAFTRSFAGLLVGRYLTGTAASSALTNGAGILSDIWGPVARGNAMLLLATMTFIGPALGPLISGVLELHENWKWAFYVLIGLGGLSGIFLMSLPETLPMIVLHQKARRLRNMSGMQHVRAPVETMDRSLRKMFSVALTRPWRMLIDPISLCVAVYYAVVYTLLYKLFDIYPIVFQQKRGWNVANGQLPFFGTVVGAVLGGLGIFTCSEVSRRRGTCQALRNPEDRLPAAMVGGVLLPVTIFWFAWSAECTTVHWAVPTIAGCFLSTAILLVIVACLNYIIDVYVGYAASAVAANTILRSASAAASPLYTQKMIDGMGVGGAGSLIGGVSLLLMPIPFVFYRYGAYIRARSRFAVADEKSAAMPSEDESTDDKVSSKSTDEEKGFRSAVTMASSKSWSAAH